MASTGRAEGRRGHAGPRGATPPTSVERGVQEGVVEEQAAALGPALGLAAHHQLAAARRLQAWGDTEGSAPGARCLCPASLTPLPVPRPGTSVAGAPRRATAGTRLCGLRRSDLGSGAEGHRPRLLLRPRSPGPAACEVKEARFGPGPKRPLSPWRSGMRG
jgi:hypothetical protein